MTGPACNHASPESKAATWTAEFPAAESVSRWPCQRSSLSGDFDPRSAGCHSLHARRCQLQNPPARRQRDERIEPNPLNTQRALLATPSMMQQLRRIMFVERLTCVQLLLIKSLPQFAEVQGIWNYICPAETQSALNTFRWTTLGIPLSPLPQAEHCLHHLLRLPDALSSKPRYLQVLPCIGCSIQDNGAARPNRF